jgi:hypothetical protein
LNDHPLGESQQAVLEPPADPLVEIELVSIAGRGPVEHGPHEGEAAGLAGEPTDDLDPALPTFLNRINTFRRHGPHRVEVRQQLLDPLAARSRIRRLAVHERSLRCRSFRVTLGR